MGLCRWCQKRYSDIADWPEEDKLNFSPRCCYPCFLENPNRVDPRYTPADELHEEIEEAEEEQIKEDFKELMDMEDMSTTEEEDDNESENNNIWNKDGEFVRLSPVFGFQTTPAFLL